MTYASTPRTRLGRLLMSMDPSKIAWFGEKPPYSMLETPGNVKFAEITKEERRCRSFLSLTGTPRVHRRTGQLQARAFPAKDIEER